MGGEFKSLGGVDDCIKKKGSRGMRGVHSGMPGRCKRWGGVDYTNLLLLHEDIRAPSPAQCGGCECEQSKTLGYFDFTTMN
jgi:hypothetical protein